MYKIIIMYLRVLMKYIFLCLFVAIIFLISSIFRPFTDKSHIVFNIYAHLPGVKIHVGKVLHYLFEIKRLKQHCVGKKIIVDDVIFFSCKIGTSFE